MRRDLSEFGQTLREVFVEGMHGVKRHKDVEAWRREYLAGVRPMDTFGRYTPWGWIGFTE